jgi:hypothetical protein
LEVLAVNHVKENECLVGGGWPWSKKDGKKDGIDEQFREQISEEDKREWNKVYSSKNNYYNNSKSGTNPKQILFREELTNIQEIPNRKGRDVWDYEDEDDRIVPFRRNNGSRYGGKYKTKRRPRKNK